MTSASRSSCDLVSPALPAFATEEVVLSQGSEIIGPIPPLPFESREGAPSRGSTPRQRAHRSSQAAIGSTPHTSNQQV